MQKGMNFMKKTLIINLFGVPGAGKSTGCAYIFSMLKMAGIDCEMITEYAKDKLWEEAKAPFENQAYIFGKQSYRISKCAGKVSVIVTDAPLPLSILYNNNKEVFTDNFEKMVMDVFNSYDSMNFLIKRVKPYNSNGRFQTEEESNSLSEPIYNLLEQYDIPYHEINGDIHGYQKIIDMIMSKISEKQEINFKIH